MSDTFVPPGWPSSVRPAGARDWELTAAAFLFDCCPPDFRAHGVLRRHPVVLARFAAHFVAGQHRTAHEGLAEVRTGLSREIEPQVLEEAVQVWLGQEAALRRTQRAVGLVEDALRGQFFVRRL